MGRVAPQRLAAILPSTFTHGISHLSLQNIYIEETKDIVTSACSISGKSCVSKVYMVQNEYYINFVRERNVKCFEPPIHVSLVQ